MAAGGQIRLLPPDVANKIAAGEVVERPAAVLKELIENALDAGATQIDVAVVAGGTKLVAVADNGSGMNRDDALLSVERHATSKIRSAADIERIRTLGFRGEALAAIASVSRFRLVTRRPGDLAGTELIIGGGQLQDVREAGAPAGTTVEVRDLFFNMPARRKFLRSAQTETAHLRQTFLVQALAHPDVGMRFVLDGHPLYTLAGGATLAERIDELFGADVGGQLRPVAAGSPEVTVGGYVGTPAVARGDRSEQYVFVNRRPASAPVLANAIAEGYHALLPAGRHPCVFLFLELPVERVDVNVHPTKKEVRFRQPSEVRDTVIQAIRQALAVAASPTAPEGVAAGPAVPAVRWVEPVLRIDDLPPTRTFRYPRSLTDPLPPSRLPVPDQAPSAPATAAAATSPAPTPPPAVGSASVAAGPWAWCRVLGQIGGLYVLLETEDGYVIMDPHAAHERVLFEQYMAALQQGRVESQGLLTPDTVELPPRDAERVRQSLADLKRMGFGISEFGGDTFVVDALPACLAGAAPRTLLADVAQSVETTGRRGADQARLREEAIAQAACKAAVKARDRLTLPDIERLVAALAGAEMPYTCPHGRPTLIFTSFKDLARKFGRE